MAQLAQAYVHLRPYEIDLETINRLGIASQERAIAAARAIYRGNVTVDVRLEEGSTRFWGTVLGTLGALNIGYGVIANYKGFKDSIIAMSEDAQKFGTVVNEAFTKDAGAQKSQIYYGAATKDAGQDKACHYETRDFGECEAEPS